MDKSKNRTDMLAAGRKKLQQFRKKKDQKGSSSGHGKSSGKAVKLENDGDPEEPAALPDPQLVVDADGPRSNQPGPSVTARDIDSLLVPSADDKEGNRSCSQECNGETPESRKDEADGSIYVMVQYSGRMLEDLAPASNPRVELAQELGQSSLLSGNGTESSSIYDNVGNERDSRQTSREVLEERGGIGEEMNSFGENVEAPSPSPNISSTNGEDGAGIDDAGGEMRNTEETSVDIISRCGSSQEESGSSILTEEVKVAGVKPSYSHEEPSPGSHLSHNFRIAEGEGYTRITAEEGDRRNDEKAMLESGRKQEGNEPLMPGEVLMKEEDTNLSNQPEITAVEEFSESMSFPSEAISAIKREDVAALTDMEGEGQNNKDNIQWSRRSEEVDMSSIPNEAFPEASFGRSEEGSEKNSHAEQDLETVASSAEDRLDFKGEENVIIAGIGVEIRALERSMQQPSLLEDVTGESLETLPELSVVSTGEMAKGMNKEDSQGSSSSGEADIIKQLLYLITVERDILRFQLEEQIVLNAGYQQNSFHEVSNLRGLVKGTQDTTIERELEQCRSELHAMSISKEEFETQCLSTKREIEKLQIKTEEWQTKLGECQEELSHARVELADCRILLETTQKEKLDLIKSLNSEKDARNALIKENEFLVSENTKLVAEVFEHKEYLNKILDNQAEAESNLGVEQLAEENLYPAISLEVHKAKSEDLDRRHLRLPIEAEVSGNQGVTCLQKDTGEILAHTGLLDVLKQHLGEANAFLYNLEKSVDETHSYNSSLTRSGGRVAAPGISKIIQAFESKAQMENASDEMANLVDGGRAEDSYTLTKKQICSLRDVLTQIVFELGKVEMHLTEEQKGREHAKEISEEYTTPIQQSRFFQERVDEVDNKVSDYKSKILDLQIHIDEVQQNTNEETVRLLSQVERLQKEVEDRDFIFKQEKSLRGVIFDAVEKLNASMGLQLDDGLDIGFHVMASVDAAILLIKSLHGKVDAAHLNYNMLQTSFEELNKSFRVMQERNTLVSELLTKMYISLGEFVNDLYLGESLIDVNTDESLQLLSANCDLLTKYLQKLIDERHYLLLTNNELEVGIANRNHEIEGLSMRCNSLAKNLEDECHAKEGLESVLTNRCKIVEDVNTKILALVQNLEGHELSKEFDAGSVIMKSDNIESEFYQSTLLRLEALVDFHLQRHAEAVAQIISSKNYLREINIVTESLADIWYLPLDTLLKQELVPKVSEAKEKQKLLSASNLQQEIEIQTLKEGLSKTEEALEASRSELKLKVSELEQSEQRLSSVREKLSIAVAKGKGLIVQRDSLKQSLVEKSSELEKCIQELQSKEALLCEVEAKLKSCSEVDRVEALESELSYIRNSATALRDSFLLKDSVLQRIEEVLEDLDMPEHFHSKDIVEKIELLSKLVAGNSSFPMSDWDQKSAEGCSHSDAGYAIMDAWKDDVHPCSNQEFYELKRKHEELQSKFYGMAEHNDMLEQSLLERNSLVQKWEEMLDRIDMPSHLRTLEPEDRIENLGILIFEIQQERDALQLKIENLGVSSNMLMEDLKESHKKISELSAEVVTVKSEKDSFFESLEKLRFQYLALSEKIVHDEVERDNLQRELAALQEKMVERAEDKGHHDIEHEMHKLHDLVLNALPDSEKFDSHGSDISYLEALVRKLIDSHTVLSVDKSTLLSHMEVNTAESNLSYDEQSPEDILQYKDQELSGLRVGLDENSQSLALAKERDEALLKCNSLVLEIEETSRQMHLLQEKKTQEMEKYQSLVLELEAVSRIRDALQKQLSQEEQKSAVAREKLNVAVRKGKGLVQQRDALKQTIEEMNSMIEQSKVEHDQRVKALESERSLLINQLAESKQKLHEYRQNFDRVLTTVNSIDIGPEVNIIDPIQKLEKIGETCRHLHSVALSSQNEAKKSKEASKLLLVELNEVQDRVDILQENLTEAEASLVVSYKQKHDAEASKAEALSHLEQYMSVHSGERKKQIDNLLKLKYGIDQLRKDCIGFSSLISDVFRKDGDLFSYMQTFFESISGQPNDGHIANLPVLGYNDLYINPVSKENPSAAGDVWQLTTSSHFDDGLISEHLAHACSSLHECMRQYDDLKDRVHRYLSSACQHETYLSETLETVKRKFASQKEHAELLKKEVSSLESVIKEKETEICSTRRNLSLLYEACNCSILEIDNRKSEVARSSFAPEVHVTEKSCRLPSYSEMEPADGHTIPFTDHSIRMMADSLLSAIQSSANICETAEGNQRELKTTILELQRELQEKDNEMRRISEELVSQIRDAEATAKRYLADLDSRRLHVSNLEKKLAEMENDKQVSLKELKDEVKSLTETLALKDQEIEGLKSGLMQALDEEESKTEALNNRNAELKDIVQEKILAMENLEASRAKALAKLSTTVSKFDELHSLSESLLAEIESLESLIQERDSEISFLRQEVTRCTNNDLASQETNKKYLSEINEVLTWMKMMVSRFGEPHIYEDDQNFSQIHVYTDILNKRISSIMIELEDIRLAAQSKDTLLQLERSRVEELSRKTENLKTCMEFQKEPFQGERDSVRPSSSNPSGNVEVEQMVQRNKVSSAVPAVTHIRSGRKVNNDQVAVAIDIENDANVLDDEDNDKAHGFKSLTMSRLVPRASRPVSDRIDGIWVSADRLLMRQPSLRLGVIIYWILLHALLASII